MDLSRVIMLSFVLFLCVISAQKSIEAGAAKGPLEVGAAKGAVDEPITGGAKGGSTFDVKQYGAKGDGSSLDTHAFLKAWEQVCSSSAKFPVLVIPKGDYVLNATDFLGPCNAPAVGVQNLALHNCKGVSVIGIQSKNSARNHMSIESTTGVTISGITLTAPETSPNTEGIDISSSSSITIKNSVIGSGDDCIAVSKNSKDINVNNVKCGPGHGISIGSLGKGGELAHVENVVVSQCTFIKTDNGARIKTWKGGRGYVRNVVYRDITLVDVKRPIIIDQNYVDKNNPLANEDSSLSISDVKFINFKGTCLDTDAITLACSNSGSGCTGVELVNVDIQHSLGGKPQTTCENASVRAMQIQPPVNCLQKPLIH